MTSTMGAEPGADDSVLPVHRERELIVSNVKQSQFVVVSGATGSGKSTQIAQYILDSVFDPDSDSIIAVSQPRRVGAISLAMKPFQFYCMFVGVSLVNFAIGRVAQERQTDVGDIVGYTVRFEDCTSERTRIRYITDGCLLRELSADPNLLRYGAVILDEAHERSLQTDILLGLLKQIALKRLDLRIVVTSATLDLEKFSSFCNSCPTLSIPGRSYPVQISHIDSMDQHRFYVDAAVELAATVHSMKPLGHILVFLTGQEEIERACEMLGKKIDSLHEDNVAMPDVVILPMYGALPTTGQSRIFQRAPPGCRKIIFASNIAETSLTVPGITYVIDTGLCKQKVFDPHTGIGSLVITKISRVSATQRAGRAGRTGPGICYRLYSEDDLESFLAETVPEIQRSNLSHTVLLLKEIGIQDPLSFPFLDRPSTNSIENALCHLFYLGGLDADGNLTDLGRKMARLPLDPTLSLVLIKSIERGCSNEMLTIAAMVSSEQLWITPSKQNAEAAEFAHMQLRSKFGDHVTLLFVYDEWVRNDHSLKWAESHYLNGRSLQTARMIRRQLQDAIRSSQNKSVKSPDSILDCRRILAEAFFNCCANRVAEGQYRLYQNAKRLLHNRFDSSIFGLHYESALRLVQPKWVVYGELVAGSQGRPTMRNVSAIEIEWITPLLPRLNQADIARLTGHQHRSEIRSRSQSPKRQTDELAAEPEPQRVRSPSPRTKAARARFAERKKQRHL